MKGICASGRLHDESKPRSDFYFIFFPMSWLARHASHAVISAQKVLSDKKKDNKTAFLSEVKKKKRCYVTF